MAIIAPPHPLYEILRQLLVRRRHRYLRYRHLRAGLQGAKDVRTVLSLGAARGEAEVALALEYPEVHFTVTDVPGSLTRFESAPALVRKLGLKNVTFGELDIQKLPRRTGRYDFVASVELLDKVEDPVATAATLESLSRRWVFTLAPFAEPRENRNAEKRKRARELHGKQIVGFDALALLRLFPGAVAIRGCYWRDGGSELRRALHELDDAQIDERTDDLLSLGEADVRPGWPVRHSEADGVWVLSEVTRDRQEAGWLYRAVHGRIAKRWQALTDRRLIELSGLFDADYYAWSCPEAREDPLGHYLACGVTAGRWPRPDFDPVHYATLAGVDPARTNPLAHYISEGRLRKIAPHPSGLHPGSPHQPTLDKVEKTPVGSAEPQSAANERRVEVKADPVRNAIEKSGPLEADDRLESKPPAPAETPKENPRSFLRPDVPLSTSINHSVWKKRLLKLVDKEGAAILEIGARRVTRGIPLRAELQHASYTGFDIHAGENVDVVGDAHRLTTHFEGKSFDLVFSSAVFEHLAMPWVVAREMVQLLKVGGYVFVETHYSFSSHERPWHFFQFSERALMLLFSPMMGIECIEAGCSNPIIGHFSPLADRYLRGRKVPGLYCHSEFLGRKTREVPDFRWDSVNVADLVEGTMYPVPQEHAPADR